MSDLYWSKALILLFTQNKLYCLFFKQYKFSILPFVVIFRLASKIKEIIHPVCLALGHHPGALQKILE
jgi:hypothetical protein